MQTDIGVSVAALCRSRPNDKEIQLRPSSTLLQLFGAPGGARDWWVVPARRLEGSIRCLSGDSLGSLSDGTPLLAIQAYQTPNLLLQCDEWFEPLLCDWASFDAHFPGSRDRIDALGPVLPNRTEALQPLLPAVRELHRQAKACDLRARPLSVIELCRHVGLEVSETACADAHLLALARKSVPALQFAHVLRGESPDRSLKALLHGQWAIQPQHLWTAGQLGKHYDRLLQIVRSHTQAASPFARIMPAPLPINMQQEYLSSPQMFLQAREGPAPSVHAVPAFDPTSLPARLVQRSRDVDTRAQGTKRSSGATPSGTSSKRVSLSPPLCGSPSAVVLSSTADASLAGYLDSLDGGLEIVSCMAGLLTLLGQLLQVRGWEALVARAHHYVRERHPDIWAQELFTRRMPLQCRVALSLWNCTSTPTVIRCWSGRNANDVDRLSVVCKGVSGVSLLVSTSPQGKLVGWKTPGLEPLPVGIDEMVLPLPDGLRPQCTVLRQCQQLALYRNP